MADKVFGLTKRTVERTALVVKRDLGTLPRAPRLTQRVYDGGTGGGACESQNAKIQWTVFGKPTGGTFSSAVEINSTIETITFNYNDNAAAVKTALAGHTQLASADMTVTGGPFPNATIEVEFIATQATTPIALPISDWGSLTGGSGVAVLTSLSQLGHA